VALLTASRETILCGGRIADVVEKLGCRTAMAPRTADHEVDQQGFEVVIGLAALPERLFFVSQFLLSPWFG
jgi:hypothetical protein